MANLRPFGKKGHQLLVHEPIAIPIIMIKHNDRNYNSLISQANVYDIVAVVHRSHLIYHINTRHLSCLIITKHLRVEILYKKTSLLWDFIESKNSIVIINFLT